MKRAIVVCALALSACATFKPMIASSSEVEIYRAFRVAAAPGTRLAQAQRYLEAHPDGTFAEEVRAAFEAEEPRFFEACQRSRAGVLRYLVDLPHGPHAPAAQALIVTFDVDEKEAELRDIASRARADDARLESAAVQRRAVSETILGTLGAMLEDGVYGVPRSELPEPMRAALLGRAPSTWGGGLPASHDEDLFFVLPTRPVRESRLLTLTLSLVEDEGGRVTATRLEGEDLFVKWTEADRIVVLDPAEPGDRTEAQVHVGERLEGALERRFPSGTCRGDTPAAPPPKGAVVLLARACAGWEVRVTSGASAGAKDTILVTGPRATKGPLTR